MAVFFNTEILKMPSAAAASTIATSAVRPRIAEPAMRLGTARREEHLLKLDLSDLVLPKINDLHVDGMKASLWSRLFGKR